MTDKTLPRYEHDGRSFTVAEWATVTGIRSYDISLCLRQGWTLARIIAELKPINTPQELPLAPATVAPPASQRWGDRLFTYGGDTMDLKAWSVKSGIPLKLLKSRLTAGWGLDRALSYPANAAPRVHDAGKPTTATRTVTFNGETLAVGLWAKRLGISVYALYWRLAHWGLNRALTEPAIRKPSVKHTLGGRTATLKQFAAEAGISYQTLVTRLRSGWTLVDAVSIRPGANMGGNAHRRQRTNVEAQPQGGGSATSERLRGPATSPQLVTASN